MSGMCGARWREIPAGRVNREALGRRNWLDVMHGTNLLRRNRLIERWALGQLFGNMMSHLQDIFSLAGHANLATAIVHGSFDTLR